MSSLPGLFPGAPETLIPIAPSFRLRFLGSSSGFVHSSQSAALSRSLAGTPFAVCAAPSGSSSAASHRIYDSRTHHSLGAFPISVSVSVPLAQADSPSCLPILRLPHASGPLLSSTANPRCPTAAAPLLHASTWPSSRRPRRPAPLLAGPVTVPDQLRRGSTKIPRRFPP